MYHSKPTNPCPEPSQRRRGYTAWPERTGQMNFDLNNGFRETPYQNTNRRRSVHASRGRCADCAARAYTKDELIEMDGDQHARLVTDELDNIRQKYVSDYPGLHNVNPFSIEPPFTAITDRTEETIRSFAASVENVNDSWDASLAGGSSASTLHSRCDPDKMETTDKAPSQMFDDLGPHSELLRDLETRAIKHAQLIQEVKGIYAGLVMVEKKCIEIVTQQAETSTKLSKDSWQALIALHRTLLNEHHDFFVATHHPTAPWELQQLASKYAIPARLWKRNLHPLLMLIQQHTENPECMQNMVQVVFNSLIELKRKVPAMETDWKEIALNLHTYMMMLRYLGLCLPETDAEITSRSVFVHDDLLSEWIKCFTDVLKQEWNDEDTLAHGKVPRSSASQVWHSEYAHPSFRSTETQQRVNIPAMVYDRQSVFAQFLPQEDLVGAKGHKPEISWSESNRSGSIFNRLELNNALWALMTGWYHLGGYISPSLRAFHKLFAYLPWAASRML